MTVDRKAFGTAHEADVEVLREAFDAGRALTKSQAADEFGIPNERRFRAAVSALRHLGYPVISESEQGSTYRKALDRDELESFIAREVHPRAVDLLEQEYQLRQHAPEHFEPSGQSRAAA